MIASLAGHLAAVEADRCTLEVGGVGYLVFASTRTLAALPHPPELARVLVETQVREDAIALYGFADPAERDWFRALTALQGVGAKLALAVLSALAPRDLVAAISAGDRAAVTRVAGVGPRLADRILAELRNKVGTLPSGSGGGAMPVAAVVVGSVESDALHALGGLGFRRVEAQEVVARVAARLGAAVTLDALIRDSLRELGPRSCRRPDHHFRLNKDMLQRLCVGRHVETVRERHHHLYLLRDVHRHDRRARQSGSRHRNNQRGRRRVGDGGYG